MAAASSLVFGLTNFLFFGGEFVPQTQHVNLRIDRSPTGVKPSQSYLTPERGAHSCLTEHVNQLVLVSQIPHKTVNFIF